jgi:hypothetical protein
MICEHGVLGMSVWRYRKPCPQSHAGQSGSHAIRQQTLAHAASSHLHPRMLAGEPDSSSWPRSSTASIWAPESSDRGSAARTALCQILNKPRAQLLGQAS